MSSNQVRDVEQQAFDRAEALITGMLRAYYPELDIRRGTAVRDLLGRPAATLHAAETQRNDELLRSRSVADMLAAGTEDREAYDAVLANFGTALRAGAPSTGVVILRTTESERVVLGAGTAFSTDASVSTETLVYTNASEVVATLDPVSPEIRLQGPDRNGYYYFFVAVQAEEPGTEYNIRSNTAMAVTPVPLGLVSATAYADFVAGTDPETPEAAMARLPVELSLRGLESRVAIESALRHANNPAFSDILQAVGVQGLGDSAQHRDSYNALGVSVGSRVDIYPRTFKAPATVVLFLDATRVSPGVYTATIEPDMAPGFYAVRGVTDRDTVPELTGVIADPESTSGGYAVTEARFYDPDIVAVSRHRVRPQYTGVDTAYTAWQGSVLTISGLEIDGPQTLVLRTEVYVAPGLLDIQDYVDAEATRSLKSDHLVRCPTVAMVHIDAAVDLVPGINIADVSAGVADYINALGFAPRLAASELTKVMHDLGVARVWASGTGALRASAVLRKANGVTAVIRGPDLSILSVYDPQNLVAEGTTVFAAYAADIKLRTNIDRC